jgi:type VI secretion system protein ImpK
MDRVTEVTEAVFNALAQIQRMDPEATPMPEVIHQQLSTYIDQGMRSASRLGFSQQDVDDMRYAIVALTDETVLQKGGALRDFWLPRLLQLRYFNENLAGEAFFHRLEAVRRDPSRLEVLRVYYLCMLFGFHGQYRVRGGQIELADILDRVRDELARAKQIPAELALSPHGPRPYEPMADAQRNLLLVWLSVVAASASVLLYIGLKLSLINQATLLIERLVSLSGG